MAAGSVARRRLVTTATAAGGSAWAAKAGAVAVIAGSAVTAPAVIDHPEERDGQAAEAKEPAEISATETTGDAPAPAPVEQPVGGVRAERAVDGPEVERIAVAGGTTRVGPDPERHRLERRPDVEDPAPDEAPPAPAPVGQPTPPEPVAPPAPLPTPTATPTPAAEAEDPVSEAPPEDEAGEVVPAEPEDPLGGGDDAVEEPGVGEDGAAPSAP
jgi:hypothetical protein